MAIVYAVVPNPLRPGTYYPRPCPQGVRDLSGVVANMVERHGLKPGTIRVALHALVDEIIEALETGERVSIDGLMELSVRLSQQMPSVGARFDPDAGGRLLVSIRVKPQVSRALRARAHFTKA